LTTYKNVRPAHETILQKTNKHYQKNRIDSFNNGDRFPTDVIKFSNGNYNSLHPTQKPLDLIKYLINTYTNPNQLILDTFAGSFTTAIACLETGRRYICIEKEEEYFEIGKERIKKWHNEQRDRTGTYELPPDIERINEDKYGQLSLF
jgi:site-specific DNA-methyltransferase (adenine-specific)